jgi:hypothetical protein
MFCTECGEKNPDTAKFCAGCGHRMTQVEGTPADHLSQAIPQTAARPDTAIASSQPPQAPQASYRNVVPDDVFRMLPRLLQDALVKVPEEKQLLFSAEYRRKARKTGLAYLLWFLGFHYAYVEQWALLILLWVSLFLVFGLFWWIVDLFRIPSIVTNYNQDYAMKVARELRIIG